MVTVGLVGQEHGDYEVVGHLSAYRMACFRKSSDEIRLSISQYSLHSFSFLLVFSPRKSEFSLYTSSLPFGCPFWIFLLSIPFS